MRKALVMHPGMFAVVSLLVASVSAQSTNPRFGRWKLKSDAPPPSSNVSIYEPLGVKAIKITITPATARAINEMVF